MNEKAMLYSSTKRVHSDCFMPIEPSKEWNNIFTSQFIGECDKILAQVDSKIAFKMPRSVSIKKPATTSKASENNKPVSNNTKSSSSTMSSIKSMFKVKKNRFIKTPKTVQVKIEPGQTPSDSVAAL